MPRLTGLKTVKQIHFLLIIINIIICDVHHLIIERGSLNYDNNTLLPHHRSSALDPRDSSMLDV